MLPQAPGLILVEVLSRYPFWHGKEVAYISLIMQGIRSLFREITIEGFRNHPVLACGLGA